MSVEWLGGSSSSYDGMAKLVVDASAGTLPDIVYAQGSQIQYYISNKIVVPVTQYLNKDRSFDLADFPKVAVDMYSRAGQVFAIPYDHGPNMLWYNADLFQKNGVPVPTDRWTWDDVTDDRAQADQRGPGPVGPAGRGPAAGWAMASYLGPWGGEWVDKSESRTGITGNGSLQAMQYWTDLFFKHKVNPVPGTYQGTADELFLQGKVGMRLGGPWTYRGWIGKLNFEAPIANWPLGPTGKRVSASMGSGFLYHHDQQQVPRRGLAVPGRAAGPDRTAPILWQFVKTGLGTPYRAWR